MNKRYIYLLTVFSCIFLSCNSKKTEITVQVPLGDPFIMLHNDIYYAYGTHAPNGIEVYTSSNLQTWEKAPELALHAKDSWSADPKNTFWAPEIYYIESKKKFFMYYSSSEHICVATADYPLGPFVQTEKKPMLEGEKCIDNSLFIDDDGKPYLYFDRFNDGLNIWVAELEEDLETIKESTMTQCIHVSQSWEEIWPRVNEGGFVVKHKGIYYLSYSANSYESPFYGIGYATATSAMGPWTKYPNNPIFQKPDTLTGVGHSAMFRDKDNKLRLVFHAHHSSEKIHPRFMCSTDVVFSDDDIPVMGISGKIVQGIIHPK